MRYRGGLWIGAAVLALTGPAQAQSYTTAAEVKPILMMTKASWIAVRAYEGQDLLYFTNALAWRCGITGITYAVNDGPKLGLAMEPCYEGEATPNALKMDQGILPFVTLPLQSVATVTVEIQFDDGTTEAVDYARAAVLIP